MKAPSGYGRPKIGHTFHGLGLDPWPFAMLREMAEHRANGSLPAPMTVSGTIPRVEHDPAGNSMAKSALMAQLGNYRRALLAYFGRRVRSAAEAEDLTQDVFERVLRSLERGPILNAEALVFRIAVNLLRDRARRAQCHGIEEPLPSDGVADFAGRSH